MTMMGHIVPSYLYAVCMPIEIQNNSMNEELGEICVCLHTYT